MAALTGTARTTVVPTPRKKRRTPGRPPPAWRYTCRKHADMVRVVGSRGSEEACIGFCPSSRGTGGCVGAPTGGN